MKSKNLFKILKMKGFKNIELDNIIESKYVLKRSGGSYRQFLFSFYDQNLKEWSLVPDLSVSSVVKFIQNKIKSKTKWFYTGEAYRKQNKNNNSPIINQTGFEIFASNNKIKDDKEIIQTSIEIFKKSNFKKGELNISNIEIFNALVERLTLARRWKDRIKRHFCREVYFNQLLKKLSSSTDIDPIAVEKDKKIAEKLDILKVPFSVNTAAQMAAISALEDDDHINFSVEHNSKWKKILNDCFAEVGLIAYPSQCNFILVEFLESSKFSAKDAYHLLSSKGIIVREMEEYNLPNCLRISIGEEEANLILLETVNALK